ncbi:hypothetical protein PL921430001 [Planktothrix tepida PCC 9214]|uniref:Uncharacterized protein n=1 Tax=Planktothrix tepida PCC 9214 TaxID=671072 RepID=A0A1J1LI32_9CYAN|nr:hypothetical protein PL921430001 [Planktothrix tepida PCC 9214]
MVFHSYGDELTDPNDHKPAIASDHCCCVQDCNIAQHRTPHRRLAQYI